MAVRVPLLLMTSGPPLVVTIVPPRTKFVPVLWIPPTALVFKSPLKVEVPLPADWVMVAAAMLVVVRFRTVEITKFPKRVVPPIIPVNAISPVPDERVRSPPPLMVEAKLMFWFAAAVVTVALPDTVTAFKNWAMPPTVIELEIAAMPFWVNAPAMLPVAEEL